MMMTFNEAVRRHSMLSDAIEAHPGSTELARDFWEAITRSQGDSVSAKAVEDTTPEEYSVLLSVEDIPAAFAVACHIPAFAGKIPRTPADCRDLARVGWDAFRAIADLADERQVSNGCSSAAAWPLLRAFTDEITEADRDRLRQVSDLAGRMTVALKGAMARKVPGVPEEISGVKMGNRFGELVPAEYARLASKALRTDLIDRVSRSRATCLQREGSERKNRGPMVFLVDESGSMRNELGGQRETYSKAAMTALTRFAWSAKRDCAVVHFSVATKVDVLRVGDHQALQGAQKMFLNGGTDIGRAIDVGIHVVSELEKKGVHGADLVLLSDGELSFAKQALLQEPLSRAKVAGVRLHTVAIGVSYGEKHPLRSGSSTYVEVGVPTAESVTALLPAIQR